MSTQHTIPLADNMPGGEMKEDETLVHNVEIAQSAKTFPFISSSKNVLFDDVELSWTDTSFETSICTSVSDCDPAKENDIMTPASPSRREGPPNNGVNSTRRNVASSSQRYASKSQLHVDSDAAEVHLQNADSKIQKTMLQPQSNDKSNPHPSHKSEEKVFIETMNSSSFPSASDAVSINLMSDFENAMNEDDVDKAMQVPHRVHSLSTRITPKTTEPTILRQHQIPLSSPARAAVGSRSTLNQKQIVSNVTSQSPMMPPIEINIDDSSSCDSVSNLDDTSSKKLSPCSSSSVDSREESIISADDNENRLLATPKAKKPTKAAAVAIVTPPDPPSIIASPVLTKSMADYVLGDSENLPGSRDGNFILTKEMFDYIMGNEDEDSTVTGSDLVIDEPQANDIVEEQQQKESGHPASNNHSASIDNKSLKKGESGNKNKITRRSSYETGHSSQTVMGTGKGKEYSVRPTSPEVFRFNHSENRNEDSFMTPIVENKRRPEEEIIFVPSVVQTTTKTSPPRKTTKVRRRSSYKIQQPTIYEDFELVDSSVERRKSTVVDKSPKSVRLQAPPPSMPTLSSTPNPSLYEAASIQELACFISPDVGSVRDRKGKRRRGSKRKSNFIAKYTYLLVVSIGVVLACLKVVDIIPGLSSKIVALHDELSISGLEGPLQFLADKPVEYEKEPPSALPKNKIARAWRKFRSRKKRRKEG